MLSVLDWLPTLMVCAIGNCSPQVVPVVCTENVDPTPICTSYAVPGVSCTRLPRHSVLRASYHMFMPWLHAVSPDLRYCTMQPAELGVELGFQYRPSEWK